MADSDKTAVIATIRAYNDVLNTLGNVHDPRLPDDTSLSVVLSWIIAMGWKDEELKYFQNMAESYKAWAKYGSYAMSEGAQSAACCLPKKLFHTHPVRNGEVATSGDAYIRRCSQAEGNAKLISHLKVRFEEGLGSSVTFDEEYGLLYLHGGKGPAWFAEKNLNPCWLDTTIQAIQGCGITYAQLMVAKNRLASRDSGQVGFPMKSLAQQENLLEKMAKALQTDWADNGINAPGRKIRRDLSKLINAEGRQFWAPTDAWEKATYGVEKVEVIQESLWICPCDVVRGGKTKRQTKMEVGMTSLGLKKDEFPFVVYRSSGKLGKEGEGRRYQVPMAILCERLLVAGGLVNIGRQRRCVKCGSEAKASCCFISGPPEILCVDTLDFGITGAEVGTHELNCPVLTDDGELVVYKVPYRWKLGIYCNGTGEGGNHFRYFEAASHQGDQVELGFYDDMLLEGAKLIGIRPDEDGQPIPAPWHTRAVILIFKRVD